MPVYRGIRVHIDLDYVLHLLRIDEAQAARNRSYVEALRGGLPVVMDKASPAVFLRNGELLWEHSRGLRFDGSLLEVGDVVQRNLSRARYLCVGIATIGPGVEEEGQRVKEQWGLLHAFAYDALGAIALDMALEEFFTSYERELCKEGLYVGVPMSPGETAGWDSRDQCSIHSILQGELEGVSITASCLLIPKNSLSFLVGIYDRPVKKKGDSHCNYCSMQESCLYRSR